MVQAPPIGVEEAVDEHALMRKVTWRLIPFMFLLYIIAYLDRVNVSFAGLQMKDELHFDDAVFGTGMGIFFIGYFLLEIPSNLILERVGARVWIARIMITWGLISAAMMFVRGVWAFYTLRFLLGLAEAGFFPGMILYLTYWFPAAERARAVGRFMTATAVANIIGAPISGALLGMHGLGGLHGWQWLFLMEGLPACLVGLVVLVYLPNGPHDARWLTLAERDWLAARLAPEWARAAHKHDTLGQALRSGRVWLLCALYFAMATGFYGFTLWLPEVVKHSYRLSNQQVGLIVAIPYVAAALGMVVVGAHSDRTGERRWHIVLPALWGVLGITAGALLLVKGLTPLTVPVAAGSALLAMTLAAFGMWGTLGPFWTLPNALLCGTAAAGGIALINAVGNLGGFVGPYLVGLLKKSTASFTAGLLFVAFAFLMVAVLAFCVRAPGGTKGLPVLPEDG